MTLVYVPTLIESVEQAEKLPAGTLARHAAGSGMDHAHKIVVPDLGINRWVSLTGTQPNSTIIGWTALVPVEAEEETRTDLPGRRGIHPVHRLVTPWEEA